MNQINERRKVKIFLSNLTIEADTGGDRLNQSIAADEYVTDALLSKKSKQKRRPQQLAISEEKEIQYCYRYVRCIIILPFCVLREI